MFTVNAFIKGEAHRLGTFADPVDAFDQALATASLHGFAVVSSVTNSAALTVDHATGEVFATSTCPVLEAAWLSIVADLTSIGGPR